MLTRDTLLAALRTAAEAEPAILAAYLGGSDASGRTDGWSDVDLVLIAEDDAAERAIAAVRGALAALCPLRLEFRMPEPAWHGMSQVFYTLADAPDWLQVDLCVAQRGRPCTLTERQRHGAPTVWFDREGLVAVSELDPAAQAEKARAAAGVAAGMLALGAPLVRKAVARGFPAEAASFYNRLVLGQVLILARALHCPDRFDFGARYLDRDVPPEVRARIERLSLPADGKALAAFSNECEAWGAELAAGLGVAPPR